MSDAALRRMVAQMPTMAESDFDAILSELSPAQRTRVLAMLDAFQGEGDAEQPEANFVPVHVPPDVSPWLVARVNGVSDSGEESVEHFTITPHCAKVLRECAAELMPQPTDHGSARSLFGRVWQRLAKGRA